MVSKRPGQYDKARDMAKPLGVHDKSADIAVPVRPKKPIAGSVNSTKPAVVDFTLRGKVLGRVPVNLDEKTQCADPPQSFAKKKPPLLSNTAPSSKAETGNPSRDKVREIMVEALSKVAGEVGRGLRDAVLARHPVHIAADVESVLFKKLGPFNGANKLKYRSIIFNMRDQNNPDFRKQVLLGEVEPEKLVTMSSEEMASSRRKEENKDIRAKALSKKIVKGEKYTTPTTE